MSLSVMVTSFSPRAVHVYANLRQSKQRSRIQTETVRLTQCEAIEFKIVHLYVINAIWCRKGRSKSSFTRDTRYVVVCDVAMRKSTVESCCELASSKSRERSFVSSYKNYTIVMYSYKFYPLLFFLFFTYLRVSYVMCGNLRHAIFSCLLLVECKLPQ